MNALSRIAALEGRGALPTDERFWPWVCLAWREGEPEPVSPANHNAVIIRKPAPLGAPRMTRTVRRETLEPA